MFNFKSVLSHGSLLLLCFLTATKLTSAQATPNKQSVDNPACYYQTDNGRVTDLTGLCGKKSTQEQLIQISKAAIDAENQAEMMLDAKLQAEGLALGVRYTGFQTELTVKKIQVQGDTAFVELNEYTVFNIEGDELALKATKYSRDRRLDFTLQNGQWKLISNKILNDIQSQPPIPGVPPIDNSVMPPASTERPRIKSNKKNISVTLNLKNLKSVSKLKPDHTFIESSNELVNSNPLLIATGSLNPTSIALRTL